MTDASIFNESHQSCFQAWLREVFQIDCEDDVETQTAPAPSPLAGSEIVKPENNKNDNDNTLVNQMGSESLSEQRAAPRENNGPETSAEAVAASSTSATGSQRPRQNLPIALEYIKHEPLEAEGASQEQEASHEVAAAENENPNPYQIERPSSAELRELKLELQNYVAGLEGRIQELEAEVQNTQRERVDLLFSLDLARERNEKQQTELQQARTRASGLSVVAHVAELRYAKQSEETIGLRKENMELEQKVQSFQKELSSNRIRIQNLLEENFRRRIQLKEKSDKLKSISEAVRQLVSVTGLESGQKENRKRKQPGS